MPKNKAKHIHKYERINVGSKGHVVFRCALPNCSHFMPTKEMAVGKESICWGCEDKFVLSRETVIREVKRPMCASCKEKRKQMLENLRNGTYTTPEARTAANAELLRLEAEDIDYFPEEN